MVLIDSVYGLQESDQLRIPTATGYVDYSLTELLGAGGGPLRSVANFGMPPIRFITQRGPFQDGETPTDMRLDPRVIQVEIVDWLCNRSDFWTRRNELIDMIRPNRAFNADGTYLPLVYRKRLPGGKAERGSDGVGDGTTTFTADYGRFVHYGGLRPGDAFEVSGTPYTVDEVVNDYTIILDAVVAVGTDLPWRYWRGNAIRDLEVLLEQGPNFDERVGASRVPAGYREALRMVAHDPVWRGATQSQSWALDDALGDLIFDGAGAWFGATAGTGRWLFAPDFVGEAVDVVYWGTWPAKPTITIAGPAGNPTVENSTIATRLEMDYTVAVGERVTINTLALTATNNAGDNLLPYLTGDLATFEISPPPQAPNRANTINVTFSGGIVGQSSAQITWRNGYIAI